MSKPSARIPVLSERKLSEETKKSIKYNTLRLVDLEEWERKRKEENEKNQNK